MDSLKSLMDKKQYDLVIKLTETATEATHLFYRISAFLAIGQADEALKVIYENRKILESDLHILIRIHLEILCLLNRFEDAYDELKYYEQLPYVSQQVEEILRAMPKYIREEERKAFSSKEMDDQQVIKLIHSPEMNDVIIALDIIRDRDYKNFLSEIKWLMEKHPQQSIRSFALLILVQKEVDGIFKFQHVDKLIEVNPSKLEPPFVGADFNRLTKRLGIEFNNPSLSDNAIQILSTYLMFIYPDKIDYSDDEILEALLEISSNYLQSKTEGFKARCEQKGIDVDRVQQLIDDINFSLENF